MGEGALALLLLYCEVVQAVEGKEMPSAPSPWSLEAVGRAGPGVMRGGELALPLTSCTTWESRPCTFHGLTLTERAFVKQPQG